MSFKHDLVQAFREALNGLQQADSSRHFTTLRDMAVLLYSVHGKSLSVEKAAEMAQELAASRYPREALKEKAQWLSHRLNFDSLTEKVCDKLSSSGAMQPGMTSEDMVEIFKEWILEQKEGDEKEGLGCQEGSEGAEGDSQAPSSSEQKDLLQGLPLKDRGEGC